MKLQFQPSGIDAIRKHGELDYPDECCGILFGRDSADTREVVQVVPIANLQVENRERRFLISPKHFVAAERHAREADLELLGFYHSHPDHPAIPSQFDRDHALPIYSYLIVSVRGGVSAEIRSWRLADHRENYDEEMIILK